MCLDGCHDAACHFQEPSAVDAASSAARSDPQAGGLQVMDVRRRHHAMRLQIKLPPTWAQQNNPDGPATFCRESSSTPGPLQVSWAEYSRGPIPNPSAADLKKMAKDFGKQHGLGDLIESLSNCCIFGTLGTAVFHSALHPRIQVWHLSNWRDFIMVTHICPKEPDPVEVRDAQEIVRTLTLGKPKPWWKFWCGCLVASSPDGCQGPRVPFLICC